MQFRIRQERPEDYPAVAAMIKAAYEDVAYSDHQEQFMVERLRNSDAFIPQLSLVAEVDEQIVGHILLTKIFIHGTKKSTASLALAPLSVVPEMQGKGVGSGLVTESHRLANELRYPSVVVLGPGGYYSRFGYKRTKEYNLVLPFDVREENCMILCLNENGIPEANGRMEYHSAWWNDLKKAPKTSKQHPTEAE